MGYLVLLRAASTRAPMVLLVFVLRLFGLATSDAPGKMSQQIVAEVSAADEAFQVLVSEEHASLLKQYIGLKSPSALVRERLNSPSTANTAPDFALPDGEASRALALR